MQFAAPWNDNSQPEGCRRAFATIRPRARRDRVVHCVHGGIDRRRVEALEHPAVFCECTGVARETRGKRQVALHNSSAESRNTGRPRSASYYVRGTSGPPHQLTAPGVGSMTSSRSWPPRTLSVDDPAFVWSTPSSDHARDARGLQRNRSRYPAAGTCCSPWPWPSRRRDVRPAVPQHHSRTNTKAARSRDRTADRP